MTTEEQAETLKKLVKEGAFAAAKAYVEHLEREKRPTPLPTSPVPGQHIPGASGPAVPVEATLPEDQH